MTKSGREAFVFFKDVKMGVTTKDQSFYRYVQVHEDTHGAALMQGNQQSESARKPTSRSGTAVGQNRGSRSDKNDMTCDFPVP